MKKTIYIVLLVGIFFLLAGSNPQREDMPLSSVTDYSLVFGDNYLNATTYIKTHPEISIHFLKAGIPPNFAWSVVFPELIRYNTVKDKIELASLYTLYINFGELYSNFSVGPFQMKPSFVKQLEVDYLNSGFLAQKENYTFDTSETKIARSLRVKRLESNKWQSIYLSIFISLLEKRYPDKVWNSDFEKLKFYASAYNYGYNKPFNEILQNSNKKYFHTSLFTVDESTRHCYSDIAVSYFTSSN